MPKFGLFSFLLLSLLDDPFQPGALGLQSEKCFRVDSSAGSYLSYFLFEPVDRFGRMRSGLSHGGPRLAAASLGPAKACLSVRPLQWGPQRTSVNTEGTCDPTSPLLPRLVLVPLSLFFGFCCIYGAFFCVKNFKKSPKSSFCS